VTEVQARLDATDDLSLAVRAACQGDDEAFRTLYRAVQPRLLRYLKALVGEDAEDVAAEAWLNIVRDLHSFTGDADGFRAWATTVARHRAMDHLRRHRRRPVLIVPVEDLVELTGPGDTAAQAQEAISTRAAIALIATLSPDQAEAVLLRAVMGLDAKSAAAVLGKHSGAVRMAAHRGLRKLAEQLAPSAQTPSEPASDKK
jgi:RNA polymerase sigma-70 factor (ECF subfamily)